MMSAVKLRELEHTLYNDLKAWKSMEPADRPYCIPNYGKLLKGDRCEHGYDLYTEVQSFSFTQPQAQALYEDGLLCLKPWDEAASASTRPEVEEILRIVERDHLRLQTHISRAPELPEGPPDSRDVLHLTRSDSGLGGSVEIRDLLHYLADRVLHCVEAYVVNEKGE